tara:strand:+ start:23014 stop:25062 length:2049 start_codon:yes stop_codon:yes gene_type:complete
LILYFLAQAFKSFAKIWRFQQEHRVVLTEAGLKRWEIGEIAGRIGQLYYAYYLRVCDQKYLTEAHQFFAAIKNRNYFADCFVTAALATKALRHYGRYFLICVLTNSVAEAAEILEDWREAIDVYGSIPHGGSVSDAAEWRLALNEAVCFFEKATAGDRLKQNTDSSGDTQSVTTTSSTANQVTFHLGGVVLCGTYAGSVKFGEWQLDQLRVHRFLEWEEEGSSGGSGDTADSLTSGNMTITTPSTSVASSPKFSQTSMKRGNPGGRSRTESFSSDRSGSRDDDTFNDKSDKSSERVSDDVSVQNKKKQRNTPWKYDVGDKGTSKFLLAAQTALDELDSNETLMLYVAGRGGARNASLQNATQQSGAQRSGAQQPGTKQSAPPGMRIGVSITGNASTTSSHFASLSVVDDGCDRFGDSTKQGDVNVNARGWAAAAAAPSASDTQKGDMSASDATSSGSIQTDPDMVLYPGDITPLTRARLFLVIDADASRQFHQLSSLGTYGYVSHGTPPVVLASPPQWPPKAPRSSQNGNFFTLCLTNPVGGLFSLCGREIGSVEKKGDNELTMKIKLAADAAVDGIVGLCATAVGTGALNEPWQCAIQDPFLKRITAHFLLMRALIAAHSTTRFADANVLLEQAPSAFAPTVSPTLPKSLDAQHCAVYAKTLVEAAGLMKEFTFTVDEKGA